MSKTLRDYHSAFIAALKKKKKAASTLLAYGKDVEQLVEELEAQRITDPVQVAQEHIESFAQNLKDKRYTDKSIVRKMNSMKAFFTYLHEEGVVEKNPVSSVERPKYENAAPRILTKVEYRALRDACRSDRRMSTIVEVLLQTGIRISELANLAVSDVDAGKRTILAKNSETNSERTIPLNN